jgi:parallel beta-helix repeat protein
MKTKLFGVLLIVSMVIGTAPTVTADSTTVVGQDDAVCGDADGCDSERLQAALDAAPPGAEIVLEGTFDFGDGQFVSLKKDVTIKGKRGGDGEYRSVIKGGMNTFALGWDPALGLPEFDAYCGLVSNPNTQRWPAKFVIEDLQFVSPTWNAISGAATSGATIRKNSFVDALQINAGCNAYGNVAPDGSGHAITFSTWPDARNPTMGDPSDIAGQITIENNHFNGMVRMDPDGFDPVHEISSLVHGEDLRMNGMMTPIEIMDTEAAVTIHQNEFENIHWGMFMYANSGAQVIKNNTLWMNPVDEYGNPIGFVWAGIFLQNTGERVNKAPVTIKGNYVFSRVADFTMGILCVSGNAIIKNNTVELDQSPESLWNVEGDAAGIFIAYSTDSLIEGNTVKGRGQTAIYVEGFAGFVTEDNVFKNNSVEEFSTQEATDIYCRAFGGVDCPTLPGAHYHLFEYTQNNIVKDNAWTEDMILFDDTSDYNPYDPATYNGDNIIELDHSH